MSATRGSRTRRALIAIGSAGAAAALVVIGPGQLAFGAKPSSSDAPGRGANSPSTPAGADGADVFGGRNHSGADGLSGGTGKQGPSGKDGKVIPRRGRGLGRNTDTSGNTDTGSAAERRAAAARRRAVLAAHRAAGQQVPRR